MLLGLRIAPSFALAPPFTLVRMPALFRVLLGLGLSAAILGARPTGALTGDIEPQVLFPAAVRELAIGMMFVLVLQLLFGALYLAGRTIDVQAGFGLAILIDPTTRAQTPLVGTLFAYATAAIFFANDGHLALLRLMAATLDAVPLGSWTMPHALQHLLTFIAVIFSMALGFAGTVIATIFLIDVAISFLSRTVPQMNILVFGFQVKTLTLLLTLPLVFSLGGTLLVRMVTVAIEAIPGMI
ncbi:MAG TPA: flagellar biosynthetic protein FliR [Acetobacteraceae bacterium]|nr:flagellar biosynthetic protein FliR [Acetobacteraceae bacterium]